LPKFTLVGDAFSSMVPVPFSVTACGLPVASLSIVTVPDGRAPGPAGVSFSSIVQAPAAGTTAPHVPPVRAYSDGLTSIPFRGMSWPFTLVSVTILTALSTPTAVGENVRLVVESFSEKLPEPLSPMLGV
jgi:hypothetical protein